MAFTRPRRDPRSHKGQNGKVLVVGGSADYVGAPTLAGLAALRSGCDIVKVASPEKVAWAINTLSPDLMTVKLPGTALTERHHNALVLMTYDADVTLIGNGIGLGGGTRKLCKRLAGLQDPKVIDADALKAITLDEPRFAVLTPNANEWRILLKNSKMAYTDDVKTIQRRLKPFFARGNTLLLKGPRSLIISGDRHVVNTNGNAGLTKGGTGDVLAGLCAGYLAQGLDPFTAARNAAHITGQVGDRLMRKHKGYTYLASDMIAEIRRLHGGRR